VTRRRLALLVTLFAVAGCATAPAARDPLALLNSRLGPGFSQWLQGPIVRLASREEVARYLALTDDAEADRFIADFWRRRDPRPATPENELVQLFERRAREADRLWSEAGVAGRHTDRGTVFILYGRPKETKFEPGERASDPPREVWSYDSKSKPALGLDGARPESRYEFVKRGDLTVFYRLPPPPPERAPLGPIPNRDGDGR